MWILMLILNNIMWILILYVKFLLEQSKFSNDSAANHDEYEMSWYESQNDRMAGVGRDL